MRIKILQIRYLWFWQLFLAVFLLTGCAPKPAEYPPEFGKYRIVIDPGHGGENEGVRSVFDDLEKHANLEVANMLKDRLVEGEHFTPLMVRTEDIELKPGPRAAVVDKLKGDAMVSIHFNGGVVKSQKGFSLIWSRTNRYRDNIRLAATISNAMIEYGFNPDQRMGPMPENALPVRPKDRMHRRNYMATAKNRGIYEDRTQYIGLLRRGKIPSVIIEGGYFSNYIECAMLKLKRTRKKMVYAIESGLIQFFAEKERIKKRGIK